MFSSLSPSSQQPQHILFICCNLPTISFFLKLSKEDQAIRKSLQDVFSLAAKKFKSSFQDLYFIDSIFGSSANSLKADCLANSEFTILPVYFKAYPKLIECRITSSSGFQTSENLPFYAVLEDLILKIEGHLDVEVSVNGKSIKDLF